MASVDTTNGQTRAAQISISSSQENPMCLGCSETVEVTKEPETALYSIYLSTDISTSILPDMDRLVN